MFVTTVPKNARGRLDSKYVDVIRETLPLIGAQITKIAPVFYDRMFAAHPELIAHTFNRGNQKSGEQQKALAASIVTFASMLVDDNAPDPVDMLSRIGHKHVSLGITEDQYPIVHKHLFDAMIQILGAQVITDEVFAAWDAVYWLMVSVLVDFEKQLYKSAGVADGDVFTKATLVGWEELPGESMEFTFQPKSKAAQFADAQPGQYVTIGVKLPDGARQLRQYSLIDWSDTGETFSVAVQRDGEVSSYLMDELSAGDVVDSSLPAGDLILRDSPDPIVLVSQGIGSTPMIGMLSSLSVREKNQEIVVLHADESESDHAQKTRAERLADLVGATYLPIYRDHGTLIDVAALEHDGILPEHAHWYLCGGSEFLQNIRHQLRVHGELVKPTAVHYELFSPNDWLTDA